MNSWGSGDGIELALVVPREQLMAEGEDIAAKILRNPRAAVESAKETILEASGRPLDDQLRMECLTAP